ncbi:MAG: hypothetical protein HYY14_05060 [Candidatus Omnitrophica bacterium]|nr:hypothetical protein [Candidatus Omnitrophota bacterium]
MMVRWLIVGGLVVMIGLAGTAEAKTVRVKGGMTKSGTYRMPSNRTSPNRSKLDNWSTKGNVNPMTGKKGTRNPW